MTKKRSSKSKYNIDDEIIIGYNVSKKMDNPPKKTKATPKTNTKNKKVTSKKKKTNKKKRKSNTKAFLKILLKIIIVIAVGTCIVLFLFVSPVFSIKEIKITGAKEINSSVYAAMSGIEVGNNIFEINKTNAISEIMKEPYVENVEIKSIYPNKIEIIIEERIASYMAESNGRYFYLDKNGYVLDISLSPLELPQLKGLSTDLEEIGVGGRINEEELDKFNDLIKIEDALKNNNVQAKLSSIDISDSSNYILDFTEENKQIMLGETTDLSAKMAWINLFIKDHKNESGIVHLNAKEVYFAPNT